MPGRDARLRGRAWSSGKCATSCGDSLRTTPRCRGARRALALLVRYHALAADYDGTLAHHGLIEDQTWAALRKLRDSGRKLIMVTGRELDELLDLIPHPELFDR